MDEQLIEYFIKNLIFIAVAVIACLMYRFIISKSKFKGVCIDNTLRYPIAYRLAPITAVGFLGVIGALVALFAPADLIYVYASVIVAIFGVCVIISRSLWRVEIGEDRIAYVSLLGVKHTYGYESAQLQKSDKGEWFFAINDITVLKIPFYVCGVDALVNAYNTYHFEKRKNND